MKAKVSEVFYLIIKDLTPFLVAQSNQFEFGRTRKKPAWVTEEIIKIKALMPAASCRLITLVFNRRFKNRESVGKTYVSYTLRQHLYEIQILRRKIKSRPAYPIPFNKVWGMDLTFVDQKPILGIIEHHSRKSMGLVSLRQKTSVAILQAILALLESAPAPQFIRTDNEACFNSRLLKFAFWVHIPVNVNTYSGRS